MANEYDALLIVSFGGPEGRDEVLPFLENVLRGRNVPRERLLEVAYRCETSTDWLLGRDVVEAEILKEADVSFRNAIEGLPMEDLESIMEFIRFVRGQRRRKEREER